MKRMGNAAIQACMRDVDRSLLRANLKLTPAQRLEKFAKFMQFASELRRAGDRCDHQPLSSMSGECGV
jgi:hypothetical protein